MKKLFIILLLTAGLIGFSAKSNAQVVDNVQVTATNIIVTVVLDKTAVPAVASIVADLNAPIIARNEAGAAEAAAAGEEFTPETLWTSKSYFLSRIKGMVTDWETRYKEKEWTHSAVNRIKEVWKDLSAAQRNQLASDAESAAGQ